MTITTSTGGSHSVSVATTCGNRATELRCETNTSPYVEQFHSLPAGDYWITVQTTASSGTTAASIALAAPTPVPPNDTCTGPIALAVPLDSRPSDTLVGFADDAPGGSCVGAGMVDAFYTFTLGAPGNVSLAAFTVPSGSRNISLTLRAVCGAGPDLGCARGAGVVHLDTTTPLPAGTYYVMVEMSEADASDFRLTFFTS